MIIKEGMLSQLFPKTFAYLQIYVTSKYPGFQGNIPDVKVKVLTKRSNSWKDLVRDVVTLGIISAGSYNSLNKTISIYIDTYIHPQSAFLKLQSDPGLACRYLDVNNAYRSFLIHEYQHFLQHKFGKNYFRRKVDIPRELIIRPEKKERVMLFIMKEIRRGPLYGFIFGGFKGVIIAVLVKRICCKVFEKKMPRTAYLARLPLQYEVDPMEIESRIAQMTYNLVLGKPVHESLSVLEDTEAKTAAAIKILKASLAEQEDLKKSADVNSRKLIVYRIKLIQRLIWRYENRLKMIPKMISEAQKIAEKVKNDPKIAEYIAA